MSHTRMGATELWLVRHGESTANAAASRAEAEGAMTIEVDQPDADVPLSPIGRRQAGALGRRLLETGPVLDGLWSSPYLRAQQTAAIAQEQAGFDLPIRIDERLRDRELGILDLLTSAGVESRLPEEARRRRWLGKFYYRPPGGESWADVALRVRSFLGDLDHRDDRGRVLVVAHDAVVMLFLYVCTGLTEPELLAFSRTHTVTNASVTRLSRPSGFGIWSLEEFSNDDHVAREGVPRTAHPGDQDVAIH
ncbi:MAG TPA: histidine phosphatase family protein [Lacisediminihabitans sp.]|uniref:histidine phosphatase family protein n=1 Tax=Lacisediminihabitans sp. TaxID=2787631 RepID=UPI002ED9C4B5